MPNSDDREPRPTQDVPPSAYSGGNYIIPTASQIRHWIVPMKAFWQQQDQTSTPIALAAVATNTKSSAISAVDVLAPLVVSDPAEAEALKIEIFSQDIYDLTAISDGNFPDHVTIPDSVEKRALAQSYAGARLNYLDSKASWRKSTVGWVVGIAVALIGLVAAIVNVIF